MSLAKAKIVRLDKNNRRKEEVVVMFNPKELTFSKQNTWHRQAKPKANTPDFDFGGGNPTTLQMQLYFDTYAAKKDVRSEYTDKIYKMLLVDEDLKDNTNGKSRPPYVRFQWGDKVGFKAVITSLTQRFTLFREDGTPVRAVLDVSFTQVVDELFYPSQNPTSGGVGGEHVWTVREGDKLEAIAYAEYGDATLWRAIADANDLTTVRRLKPGTQLMIPNA
ncbi:MAG: LysM peptidoglycan-binding domain-containing protein [Acidobacteria bacterium]|nr:LysM peptidoglycan-binding domain-containing protein [Acidobacteriota bacterium]